MTTTFSHSFRTWIPVFTAGLLVFILANCARESRPTGGLKDTTAPNVVWEKPINNSVSVEPQKITIKFDESVKLNKVQENCIISPAFDEFPKITTQKNKVIISLKDNKLLPNTTYNFSFTNAIEDINEGNKIETYSYAFSTSTVIDSFKIAGKVIYAEHGIAPKSAFVLLHSDLNDSAFSTKKPKYVTQTTKDGSFEFNHIAPGTYKLFALEDANKDYIFNQANEKIAFYDTLITPSAQRVTDTVWFKRHNDSIPQSIDSFEIKTVTRFSHQNIVLQLFKNSTTQLEISNAKRISQYTYGWKFSKPVSNSDFSVHIPNYGASSYTTEILTDSVILWLTDTSLIKKPETKILVTHFAKTDTLSLITFKDAPQRLGCDMSKNKSIITPNEKHIAATFIRPITTNTKNMYIAQVKDTSIFASMWNTPLALDSDKQPIIESQLPPIEPAFTPKFFYATQELLSYKTGQHRCAFYFAQPIQLSDIQLQLELFPNINNWYTLEYDTSSNAILCWITNTDIMKLKNISIIITYPSQGTRISKTIEFSPGFSKKDSFKNTKPSRVVADVLEQQKKELLLDNAIHIVCNNPVQSITKELFTLTNNADSLQQSCITQILQFGTRGILVYYKAKPTSKYTLRIEKDAITDIYGTTNKEKKIELQTQSKTSTKLYTPISTTIEQKDLRTYHISRPTTPGSYALIAPQAAYTDIYGAKSDSCVFYFQIPKSENYGTLNVQVKPYNQQLIIQLYKKDSKTTTPDYELSNTSNAPYVFTYIVPGEYSMRAIVDRNVNKKWDSGNLETRQQPEPILLFEKPITIKANWDNTIEWKMEN